VRICFSARIGYTPTGATQYDPPYVTRDEMNEAQSMVKQIEEKARPNLVRSAEEVYQYAIRNMNTSSAT
jgi:hypothetical protein